MCKELSIVLKLHHVIYGTSPIEFSLCLLNKFRVSSPPQCRVSRLCLLPKWNESDLVTKGAFPPKSIVDVAQVMIQECWSVAFMRGTHVSCSDHLFEKDEHSKLIEIIFLHARRDFSSSEVQVDGKSIGAKALCVQCEI